MSAQATAHQPDGLVARWMASGGHGCGEPRDAVVVAINPVHDREPPPLHSSGRL